MSRTERRAELADTYRAIREAGLPHVLVGGWAVSAFQTRFTTDIDTVVPSVALDRYHDVLSERGYEKTYDSDVSNVYEGRTVGYERKVGEHCVEFDALVDAIRCRQTDAEWSFRYLLSHSVLESVDVAQGMKARIPEPELLFALKLHSGRRADVRDLVVIATAADLQQVDRHIYRGDADDLSRQIHCVLDQLSSAGFEDAFKGVFRQESVPDPDVDAVVSYLRSVVDNV